jgi:hypothetical protein
LKNVAGFRAPKNVRQLTTIHQQSTTTSPQKHHVKNARFRKTPRKSSLFTMTKKVITFVQRKVRPPLVKSRREGANCSTSEVLPWH